MLLMYEKMLQEFDNISITAIQTTFCFQSVDIAGLGFGQADYYPYVYYKINIDMIDTKSV